jgi:hypothetical protein
MWVQDIPVIVQHRNFDKRHVRTTIRKSRAHFVRRMRPEARKPNERSSLAEISPPATADWTIAW